MMFVLKLLYSNKKNLIIILLLFLTGNLHAVEIGDTIYTGKPFGELKLLDEINCGNPNDAHPFKEEPEGISRIETILDRACKILPNKGDDKYFAYLIGKDKGLKAGNAYVLSIEYPEDKPRSMFIINRGADIFQGFHTGSACGDAIYTYTCNNIESINIPLTGKYQIWRSFFFVNDHIGDILIPRKADKNVNERPFSPGDGFWVVIAQPKESSDPISEGAAVRQIRLYEVPGPEKYYTRINYPPAELPRRYIFVREEMADAMAESYGRGVMQASHDNMDDFFENKAKIMRVLGMNTYCKDLLEFGHNQGWNSADHNWYHASSHPFRWQRIIDMATKHRLFILPYYEYAGGTASKGLGVMRIPVPLSGNDNYTHITWNEKRRIDITDPETLGELQKILNYTIVRHKDKGYFIGAWIRSRVGNIPMSFADSTLKRFAEEANKGKAVAREQLQGDPELLDKYYQWWFLKRKEFLKALWTYLVNNDLGKDIVILHTTFHGEPGPPVSKGFKQFLVTDDLMKWEEILTTQPGHNIHKIEPVSFNKFLSNNIYQEIITTPQDTWAEWEWHHAVPWPDPENYKDVEGILLAYPFHRAYTVSRSEPLDAFRTKSGLAVIRHFPLNEHIIKNEKVGYFVSDMERAGPYCMLGEARAMAYGDPRFIGYLSATSWTRGFPEYVRRFNAAFLSLPALPSKMIEGVCKDPEVVVRMIKTEKHGTYFAIINTGLIKKQVVIKFPVSGEIISAVSGKKTGKEFPQGGGKLKLSLYPCELKSILIK